MDFSVANIALIALVVALSGLLLVRQKQIKQLNPVANLTALFDQLSQSMRTSRIDGNIQKVANEISHILIRELSSDRILFFRRQKKHLEMNYIYGVINLVRSEYRIQLSKKLSEKLISGDLITSPNDYVELLGDSLKKLVAEENLNLAFPIFWKDNLFGLYFIRTSLSLKHPLIKLFLMFLNQNLSVAYHVKRLESNRDILQSKLNKLSSAKLDKATEALGEDPGHLVEMFSLYSVNDLKADVADRLKAGLRASSLVFISKPQNDDSGGTDFSVGIEVNKFSLDGEQFKKLFGSLKKNQTYETGKIREIDTELSLKKKLSHHELSQVTRFSFGNDEQGLLFWSPRKGRTQPERKMIGRLEKIARQAMVNAKEFERMEEMIYTDSLTGLYNYRYFVRRLAEEIQRAKRYNRQVGMLLFDIDDFKLYNDTYGHQWGDRLLRKMGEMLGQTLRSIDIISRYGGDEFCIIMPEADKATCGVFMDRLRQVIMTTDFHSQLNEFEGRVTISVGGAVFPTDADSAEKLIYCSDMALLKAKASGRNRSIVFESELLKDSHP